MKYSDFKKLNLPKTPGVYFFVRKNNGKEEILYIGKAASLKDRVKSYFGDDILSTRGLHISNMIMLAQTVRFTKTDSVLEALLFENNLIKKHEPRFNTKEKDDKSFNCVVITKEKFPRVLIVRGRNIKSDMRIKKAKYVFGPFPQGTALREAMKIIRKIFPYRDVCVPNQGKPCFSRQIYLCPGICTGEISEEEYGKTIRNLKLFFDGKKRKILKLLEKEMKSYAKDMQFEKADTIKKRIFALKHIKDISLIKDNRDKILTDKTFRIEAYDIAHISGTARVGAMVVVENGRANKSKYRKFKLQKNIIDDIGGIKEILLRRLKHTEWKLPDLIVVDGSIPQKNIAEKIVKESGFIIPVVAVVKNERHKPERIIGDKSLVDNQERGILISNSEAHRFAIAFHRKRRSGVLKVKKNRISRNFLPTKGV